MKKQIHMRDFLNSENDKQDMTRVVFRALLECRGSEATELVFSKDTYHFRPDNAFEKYCFLSNNDHSLKRMAFPLMGLSNITIEGNGSLFIFHGRMIPFFVENSQQVTIRNVSIDYERPFFTQGEIVSAGSGFVDLRIDKRHYPYHLDGDTIVFEGDNWTSTDTIFLLEFDPATGSPAYRMKDNFFMDRRLSARQLENGLLRLEGEFAQVHNSGNIMVILHEKRYTPGICIKDSRNVAVDSVNIYQAGAMGILAQKSENISITNVNVIPSPQSGRLVSVNADATHFVNCTGKIRVEGCCFESQLDDPINVHGIYTRVTEILSPCAVEVELVHFQQYGAQIYTPGDRIAFIDRKTLLPYADATVKEAILVNQRLIHLLLKEEIPLEVKLQDGVENVSSMPELIFRNCRCAKNRARGLLITTPGKVLVENNILSTAGAAILISGDCNYWYESGAVQEVVIRNNQFIDCNYGSEHWGNAVIDICPEIEHPEENQRCYHQNIHIENNTIATFDRAVVSARSVENLVVNNNVIQRTDTYGEMRPSRKLIQLTACKAPEIVHNRISDFPKQDFLMFDEVTAAEVHVEDNVFSKLQEGEQYEGDYQV